MSAQSNPHQPGLSDQQTDQAQKVSQPVGAASGVAPGAGVAANSPLGDAGQGRRSGLATQARSYWELLKPRVMTLVIFTGIVGLVVSGGTVSWLQAIVGILCLSFGAGSAGALNMWIERKSDALMERTAGRPLPQGRVTSTGALVFGLVVNVASVLVMGFAVNWVAAGILAFASFFYVVIYTLWLKPRTPQNIVIGGAAGAFPPMIGWAIGTGQVSWIGFSLFLLIFAWTPPHSWALAIWKRLDYSSAGIPMLPVVAGTLATTRQIIVYSWIMVASSLVPVLFGGVGALYTLTALGCGALFLAGAYRVHAVGDRDLGPSRQLFGYSLLYLAILFLVAALDARQSVTLL